ncbi:hypothetical protein SS50377_21780 [Spironucleus salmonicida]|uniref:EF-hand domain-containing protein n=1 Tax=Spironucleus salmonicida TaxID=348837 RepID=V6LLE4_9EUKA|nr:hypothetical protein SS50377_21780 [Spironucleus salmonicida]|eukprot:EST45470.1 hypothetical protein SS50377_14624 [Spironucleus salmonicida]
MAKKGKKKLTPEEIQFNAAMTEYGPIFALFDADADGIISLREFEHFATSIGYPVDGILKPKSTAPPDILGIQVETKQLEIPDFMQNMPEKLTQAMAIQTIVDLKRLTSISDRLKYEIQHLLSLQQAFPHPILERKQLFALLSVGERPMTGQEYKWFTDAIKKEIATVEIEKNLRVDGMAEDDIREKIEDIEKRKNQFLDLRETVKMVYESCRDGKALSVELRTIHQKEKEKKQKEKDAKKK